jgi:hypothetical protein
MALDLFAEFLASVCQQRAEQVDDGMQREGHALHLAESYGQVRSSGNMPPLFTRGTRWLLIQRINKESALRG